MTDLNALDLLYPNTDLVILATPCNNFGLQEPATNEEILNCYEQVRPGNGYVPTYEISQKLEVNGNAEDGLYTYLKEMCPSPDAELYDPGSIYFTPTRRTDVGWNFEKFLIDTFGEPYKRYESSFLPTNTTADIDFLLAQRSAAAEAPAKKHKLPTHHRGRPSMRLH